MDNRAKKISALRDIAPPAKLLLYEISEQLKGGKNMPIPLSRLSRATGYSYPTIQKHLADIEGRGLIAIERHSSRRKPNRYTLTI